MASADADPARRPGYAHTGEPSAVAAGSTESGGNSSSACHLTGQRPFPPAGTQCRTNRQFPKRDQPRGMSFGQRFLTDFKEAFPDVASLTNEVDTGYFQTRRWTPFHGPAIIF